VDDEAADAKVDQLRVREAPVPPKAGDAVSVAVAPRPAASVTPSSSKDKRRHEGPVAQVLTEDDMLGCIFGFLQGKTARQSVKVLGQLRLVCRTWREVACWEQWWGEIREELIPSSGIDGQVRREGGRTRLMQYGRMLVERISIWRVDTWTDGLEMHFEVFDRRDGMQLLSARGTPIFCYLDRDEYELQLQHDASLRVRESLPFSPKDRGCEDISTFTKGKWWHADGPGLCVRVSMSEQRTGRRVLLWDEGTGTTTYRVDDGDDEGRFSIVSHRTLVVQSIPPYLNLECSTRIVLRPEPDQEGVAERDKLYRVIGRGDVSDYEGPLGLLFRGEDVLRVPSWIRSLLAMEH
jgi:hypothetical protein